MDVPEDVDVQRPAVALKIENSPQARPQAGLENADVVYEEIVEGGITRFMAIYHCDSTDKAGPVRSARFDDPKLALPYTKMLVYSGANAIVERELDARKLIALDEDETNGALYRVPPGTFEVHNLFADVGRLRKQGIKRQVKAPSDQVFNFGELEARTRPAKRVTMNFTSSVSIEYKWKNGMWRRFEAGSPFMTEAGRQIAVPNLLVQEVEVNPSPNIVDVAGNRSPDILLKGRGRAFLFRDGQVIKGFWKIDKEGTAPVFQTKDGGEFLFAPGPIWIELVPSKKGAVKGSFSFS